MKSARKMRTSREPDGTITKRIVQDKWISTIYTKAWLVQHAEHLRAMDEFQPRPDIAAFWVFDNQQSEQI